MCWSSTTIIMFCFLNLLLLQVWRLNRLHYFLSLILGGVIPTEQVFQNKGCMLSVCFSKGNRVTAVLAYEHKERVAKAQSRNFISDLSQNFFLWFKLSLHGQELKGNKALR